NGALTVWPARANSATKSARQISAGPAQGRDSGRAKKSAKSKRGPASCGPLARAEPYTSPASGGKLAEASAHAHDRALVRRLGPMMRGAPADVRARFDSGKSARLDPQSAGERARGARFRLVFGLARRQQPLDLVANSADRRYEPGGHRRSPERPGEN